MREFIKKSLFFTMFFAFFFGMINLIFLGTIAFTDWDFKKRLESLKFNDPDFELLVFGSSLAQHGIDTEFLTAQGIKSYNLGMVGNSVETCYIQLNEYLTKYPKRPQYVLVVINSYLERLEKSRIQPIVEFTMKDYKYGVKDIPLLKFGGVWFGGEVLKKIFSSNHRKAKVVYGQIKREKATPDKTDFKELYLDIQKVESSHWIGEILKLCDQNGIEMINIEIPGVRETQNLSEIGPYTLHYKNGHSSKLYNFNSRDFCVFIDADKDWIGDSHFNPTGARKFTQELIRIFK